MRFILITALACAGCAEYQDAQLQLIDQARKGVAMISQARSADAARAQQLEKLQRKALDDAFDQDVQENETLSPEWVIAHRKAYAVGLDALHTQLSAAKTAGELQQRNLQAVDAALASLKRITQAEQQIINGEK